MIKGRKRKRRMAERRQMRSRKVKERMKVDEQ